MQILGAAIHIQQTGDDFSEGMALLQMVHCADAVRRIVVGIELAQMQDRSVMLDDAAQGPRRIGGIDLVARQYHVEAVDRVVVFAHVVVALGRAGMVVEGHAGTDHVDEGRTAMAQCTLDQRDQLFLVARKTAGDIAGAELQGERHQIDRRIAVHHPALALRALVGGGRELALGQAIDAVVLDDVGHVDAAPHGMGKLADADRRRIAVARDAHVDQVAIGQRGAGKYRGHAAVGSIETVRGAKEVVRRLRRAADARKLGDAMRLDVEVKAGLHHRSTDRVVTATGAQGGDGAFVVAPGVAQGIPRSIGAQQFGFGEIGHEATCLRMGVTLCSESASAILPEMKRAVIGVPS